MSERPLAIVTGASGYLGARICSALEGAGWEVAKLVRSPNGERTYMYDLSAPVTIKVVELLQSAQLLVHAAYDLRLTRAEEIRRVNVGGSRRLLEAAQNAGVPRVLVLSSMSAFEGTSQLYGRAKLEIETITLRSGGCAIRPGLVFGDKAGGMAGALRKLTGLPVVPLISGDPNVYLVREEDFTSAITSLAAAEELPPGVLSIVDPVPLPLRDVMTMLAARDKRRLRFVEVPWRTLYLILRAAEAGGLRLPFRADSLLGLVRGAPYALNADALGKLGISLPRLGITGSGVSCQR